MKRITLKWPCRCKCGAHLARGSWGLWDGHRVMGCYLCAK